MMRRADPFAPWQERANWIVDLAEWVRREPAVSLLNERAWRRVKHQRVRFLLNWLDQHRDVSRMVRTTLQKTLREAVGPDLFSVTGLPRETAFLGELSERIFAHILPRSQSQFDLSALFVAMFPAPADADWLLELDRQTLSRLWRLCADDGIDHAFQKQIDEALLYLITVVVAVGVSPAFRERLDRKLPLQATPFMALRRELENYLRTAPGATRDESVLRSIRMLIAVCQAQTDRIYAHLDEYGVSLGLVYNIERMRAQLTRMARLLDVRDARINEDATRPRDGKVQALLADLVAAHHHRSSVRSLIKRSFSLIARKMVERNADHGELYIARDRQQYGAHVNAAYRGGVIAAFTVLAKFALSGAGMARFFEGLLASMNYAGSFIAISAVGGTLAGKQPAVIAPALAAKMGALETVEGMRALVQEIAGLLRAQFGALWGNLVTVMPVMALVSIGVFFVSGTSVMSLPKAHAELQALSILGLTPLLAAGTGVLLWLSGVMAGVADNWFALRRLREALTHHRRLNHVVGAVRAARWAAWLERHIAGFVGNLSLAVLLGMTPVLANFFGLPLDVRHVTLAAGSLTAAGMSLGWHSLLSIEFWLACAGVGAIGMLNLGVAFSCALALALRAREIPARLRQLVRLSLWRELRRKPAYFLLPDSGNAAIADESEPAEATFQPEASRRKSWPE